MTPFQAKLLPTDQYVILIQLSIIFDFKKVIVIDVKYIYKSDIEVNQNVH